MIRLSFAAYMGEAALRSHNAAMARSPAGSVGPLEFSGGKWVYTMMLP